MRRLLLSMLLLAFSAMARTPDGTLDGVIVPNSGRPAVVSAGESFVVITTESGRLSLVGNGTRHALGESSESDPITLPAGVVPGRYTLELETATTRYASPGAVFVLKEPLSDYYVIAHLGEASALSDDLVTSINTSDASAVFISGARPSRYAAVLSRLEEIDRPTFIAPPSDLASLTDFTRRFGPVPFIVHLGEDAYLSTALAASDLLPGGNQLYPLRRGVRAGRWTVGLVDFYRPFADLRAQWALLADDPIDYLLATRPPNVADDAPEIAPAPWGNATIILSPRSDSDILRIIDVTAAGMRFRPITNTTITAEE